MQKTPARSDIVEGKASFYNPSFSLSNRLRRAFWNIACSFLFRLSPRRFHSWRAGVLRLFGAKLGKGCHIYPKAVIWAPWNLICADVVAIADGAIIYNPEPITLGSHAIISQEAYLCGASHDMDDPDFPLIAAPIVIGDYAWICSRATVLMKVRVAEGAVLALGSVATKDLEPWSVYAGIPARKIKDRKHSA